MVSILRLFKKPVNFNGTMYKAQCKRYGKQEANERRKYSKRTCPLESDLYCHCSQEVAGLKKLVLVVVFNYHYFYSLVHGQLVWAVG